MRWTKVGAYPTATRGRAPDSVLFQLKFAKIVNSSNWRTGIHVKSWDHDCSQKGDAVREVIRFILSSPKMLVKALKAFDTLANNAASLMEAVAQPDKTLLIPMHSHRLELPILKSASCTISATFSTDLSLMPKRFTKVQTYSLAVVGEFHFRKVKRESPGDLFGIHAKTNRALGSMNLRMSQAEPQRSMPGRGRVSQTFADKWRASNFRHNSTDFLWRKAFSACFRTISAS